jgi:hypothetical protein
MEKKTLAQKLEEARAFIFNRQAAYKNVFGDGEHAKLILKDLAKFCRAEESCFHMDPRAHALAEGRREVWLRIQSHLNLTSEELAAKYKLSKEET